MRNRDRRVDPLDEVRVAEELPTGDPRLPALPDRVQVELRDADLREPRKQVWPEPRADGAREPSVLGAGGGADFVERELHGVET